MKIRYKKKRLYFYLVMILVWTILLVLNIIYGDSGKWVFYIGFFLPINYILIYTYEYINQYLTVKDGFIYRNSIFPKKMELAKIKKFKKFAGDYILESKGKKLSINTNLIDPKSLEQLERTLSNFGLG